MKLHKGRNEKNSKSVGTRFNAIGSTLKDTHAVNSFCSWYRKAARSLFTYSLTGRLTSLTLPYSLTLLSSCFTLLYSSLPFYWNKINVISLPSSFGRKYSKTFSKNVFAKVQLLRIKNILRQFQIMS